MIHPKKFNDHFVALDSVQLVKINVLWNVGGKPDCHVIACRL